MRCYPQPAKHFRALLQVRMILLLLPLLLLLLLLLNMSCC